MLTVHWGSEEFQEAGVRDGGTEKMPRVEIEFGASFHEP